MSMISPVIHRIIRRKSKCVRGLKITNNNAARIPARYTMCSVSASIDTMNGTICAQPYGCGRDQRDKNHPGLALGTRPERLQILTSVTQTWSSRRRDAHSSSPLEKADVLCLLLIDLDRAPLRRDMKLRLRALNLSLCPGQLVAHLRQLLLQFRDLPLLARDRIVDFFHPALTVGDLPLPRRLRRRCKRFLLVLQRYLEPVEGRQNPLLRQPFLCFRLDHRGLESRPLVQIRDRGQRVEILVNRRGNGSLLKICFRQDSLVDAIDFLWHRLRTRRGWGDDGRCGLEGNGSLRLRRLRWSLRLWVVVFDDDVLDAVQELVVHLTTPLALIRTHRLRSFRSPGNGSLFWPYGTENVRLGIASCKPGACSANSRTGAAAGAPVQRQQRML